MTHNQLNDQIHPAAEQAISALLRDFGEHPSKEFHARHAEAPWMQASVTKQRRPFGWHGMLMASLTLLLISLWFAAPSGFVAALSEFFGLYRAPSDTVESVSGPIIFPDSVATVAEAEALVGFDILTPAQLPPEIHSIEINVDGEQPDMFAHIHYLDAGNNARVSLTAKQGPLYLQIGATAEVEIVQVGNASAEYFQGGFINNGTVAVWNSNYPNKTLRWQVGDISYMLSSVNLSKQELINFALSLQ
ncbi:hypothetical protein [Herpetosiphon geysericola]|uniref:DUF4367 domain-containing protein n=1 Tax=Herpetosiphon geysericola TaxID=70996 RepID=A0A0P6XZ68_9CHLR|nr:hypothetical protein [Herpetosiphon geysericola]KPL90193.1 hypothetical protein SE18_08290 [Herpetosiphon geysericola]